MTKRAIIYARVSTDDQRNNYSISSQIAECIKYIQSKGYSHVGNRFVDPENGFDAAHGIPAFVDDFSSRELNRPGLDAAFDYLANYGYDIVVVYSIDRMDRDPYKLRTHEYGFIKGGALVEYVKGDYTDTPEGQFLKTVVASAAKLDNDWRTERFNRGKRQKARRGLFVSGRAPYGYQVDKTALGGLSVNEGQASVVKWIYESYVIGNLSIYGIIDGLNHSQSLPYMGNTWQKSSVSRILSNPMYIGTGYYNKNKRNEKKLTLRDREEWIEFTVPSIVEKDIFEEAQNKLDHNKEYLRKQPNRFYLLSGLVHCEECNGSYVSQTAKAGKRGRLNDAQFYRHRVKQGHCRNHTISARRLEPIVWDKIKALLLDPESLRAGYSQALEKEQSAHKRQFELREIIYADINKLEQRQINLTRAYTDPDFNMTKVEYLEQRVQIQNDLKNAKSRLAEVESRLAELPTPQEYDNLERFAAELKERISGDNWKPTPANMRRVLELLHIQVRIDSEGKGRVIGWFGDSIGFKYTTTERYGQKAGYFSIPFEIA